MIETRERVIPLSGGHNFRDMGGYPAANGRMTAWGKVFRSGTMAELADDDHAILENLGLRLICDFRTTRERRNRPSRLPPTATFEVWVRDHQSSSADLIQRMREPGVTAAKARDMMIELYRDLAYEQVPAYKAFFSRLSQGHVPVTFHCSAGKDRTGVAAAILLDMLGVPRDVILEDYIFTDRFFDALNRILLSDPTSNRLKDIAPEIYAPMLRADPAYLDAMFETIDARHGGSAGYLRDALELGDDALTAIREELLV